VDERRAETTAEQIDTHQKNRYDLIIKKNNINESQQHKQHAEIKKIIKKKKIKKKLLFFIDFIIIL